MTSYFIVLNNTYFIMPPLIANNFKIRFKIDDKMRSEITRLISTFLYKSE